MGICRSSSGDAALKYSQRILLWRWLRRRWGSSVDQQTSKPTHHIISAKGVDLNSIEEMMNRRMRMIWVKHTWFVILLATALMIGLVVLTVVLSTKNTDLRIAVGPQGSDDVRFVESLGDRMKTDKAPFKVTPVVKSGPVDVMDIRGKPEFDLAVVRGNMKLSNDWPVVAILRQDVVALMVPPVSARQKVPAPKGKNAKAAPKPAAIEKVSDLTGKRIAIVSGTDGGPELLDVILSHYGVPKEFRDGVATRNVGAEGGRA